jgi:hypothetical protein
MSINWNHAKKIIIPPSTKAILAMIENEGMTLKKAISELIVNALDQNATNIELVYRNERVELSDNGNGCPNLERMLRLGESFSTNPHITVGRYGVGFKDAVIFFGDLVEVHSCTRNQQCSSARADWQEMIRLGDWTADFIDESDRIEHGVIITISRLRTERLDEWEEVPEYIASLFSAAIDAGVFITVDGIRVRSLAAPELEETIHFHGIYHGKRFEGFCGILIDRTTARSGWEIRWGPLTIDRGYQKDGFAHYSPQGFYGRLLLKDGEQRWTLSRNKTRVKELGSLLRDEQIQRIIKPILEKLKARGQTVVMKLNRQKLQQFCQKFLQRAKVRQLDELENTGADHTGGKIKGSRYGSNRSGNKPRRKRQADDDASLRDKLNRANDIQILPHDSIEQYGLGYVDITENGTIIKVFIENCTPFGQWLWGTVDGAQVAQHYAVGLFAAHYALSKDQLEFDLALPVTVETTQKETQAIARIWSFCTQICEFHLSDETSAKVA